MQHRRAKTSGPPTASEIEASVLVRPLLSWFKQFARDLPWRRARSAYGIWISEIMLQQTQVKTVIPYWLRWMRELPDIDALNRAPASRVLKLWEGLGYYSRARNLHSAARMLAKTHAGRFPQDFNAVWSLPGVGRYTAGAVCSIAFNQPVPILDGNVIRVLTRINGIRRNPRERKTNEQLWQLAGQLVHEAARIQRGPQRNCSDLNQALMELGALVCLPRQPRCSDCPVHDSCVALREQRISEIPDLDHRPQTTPKRVIAFVIEHDDRFLARPRPSGVVNAGLWEFPNVEVPTSRANVSAIATKLFGLNPATTRRIFRTKHSITRYRITLDVYRVESRLSSEDVKRLGGFKSLARLDQLAFASAHRRILAHLRAITKRSASARSDFARRRTRA